jgi:2-aminoadipate transaminase
MKSEAIERLMRVAASTKGVISLGGGQPAPETFPKQELGRAAEAAATVMAAGSVEQDWPEGRAELRGRIARRLGARGATVDPDDVLLTHGAHDALGLALQLLDAREVHVDDPTSNGALELLHARGITAVTGRAAPIAYVMPSVHNPSGFTMTPERRKACRSAQWIIEDDTFAELTFDARADTRPLLADAPERTLLIGSFSKTVSPGLRVGWVVAPTPLRGALRQLKARQEAPGAGGLAQAIVERLMVGGELDARLTEVRAHYHARCERMLELLPKLKGIRFGWPQGGFSVWVETESLESDERFLARALTHGVAFDAGSMFRPEPSAHATLSFRLCFSSVPLEKISEGMTRLSAALDEARAGRAASA